MKIVFLGLLAMLTPEARADAEFKRLRDEFHAGRPARVESLLLHEAWSCSSSVHSIRGARPAFDWDLTFREGWDFVYAFGGRLAFQIPIEGEGAALPPARGGVGLNERYRVFIRANSFRDLVIEIAAPLPTLVDLAWVGILSAVYGREYIVESEPTAISDEALVAVDYFYCDRAAR